MHHAVEIEHNGANDTPVVSLEQHQLDLTMFSASKMYGQDSRKGCLQSILNIEMVRVKSQVKTVRREISLERLVEEQQQVSLD